MRAQHTVLLIILMAVLTAMLLFDPMSESYIGMAIQRVDGKPYLLLQEKETFSLYAPQGEKAFEGWKPVSENRTGYIFGTFELPKSEGLTRSKLGLFFDQRVSSLDIGSPEKSSSPSLPLNLKWPPETATELNGKLYCFGAQLKDSSEVGTAPAGDVISDGALKAARLDGDKWTEVPTASLKEFRFGEAGVSPRMKPGFWLRAVQNNGKIAVIWRTMDFSQTAGTRVEGLRLAGQGETWITNFDGEKFAAPVEIKNLPAGNMSVWDDQGALKFLIQTRGKSSDSVSGLGVSGRAEIWTVALDGTAKLVDSVTKEKGRIGLFTFIAAEHFKYLGREHVLRSTWQKFEVLRKGDDGAWLVVTGGASGLPVFALERWLWGALAVCMATVLFGVYLAFVRRRRVIAALEKVKADELLAPLGMRASASVLDWVLVLAATWVVAHFDSDRFIDILPSPLDLPYAPFMLCALVYYVGFEWLCGTTPGKFAMGLCVVGDNGLRSGLSQVFIRNLLGLYERHPFYLVVAAPMLFFSPRRQRIGDLLARTIVVQRRGLDRILAQRAVAAAAVPEKTIDLLDDKEPQ